MVVIVVFFSITLTLEDLLGWCCCVGFICFAVRLSFFNVFFIADVVRSCCNFLIVLEDNQSDQPLMLLCGGSNALCLQTPIDCLSFQENFVEEYFR